MYLVRIRRMEDYFKRFTIEYIEQTKNAEVVELVKAAACNTPTPADVFFPVLEDALVETVPREHRIINIIEG
jgi:hypothetical protein